MWSIHASVALAGERRELSRRLQHLPCVVPVDADLERHVETDPALRCTGAQHRGGCLGIDPDVELAGHVTVGHGAEEETTHDDDLLDGGRHARLQQ